MSTQTISVENVKNPMSSWYIVISFLSNYGVPYSSGRHEEYIGVLGLVSIFQQVFIVFFSILTMAAFTYYGLVMLHFYVPTSDLFTRLVSR